jgi:hypothetical protein
MKGKVCHANLPRLTTKKRLLREFSERLAELAQRRLRGWTRKVDALDCAPKFQDFSSRKLPGRV